MTVTEYMENTRMAKIRSSLITVKADILVSVDESLTPPYETGDLLAIHSQPDVFEGELGAYLIDGKPHIKIRGKGELLSLNKAISPVPFGSNVEGIGKVIGVVKAEDVCFSI